MQPAVSQHNKLSDAERAAAKLKNYTVAAVAGGSLQQDFKTAQSLGVTAAILCHRWIVMEQACEVSYPAALANALQTSIMFD